MGRQPGSSTLTSRLTISSAVAVSSVSMYRAEPASTRARMSNERAWLHTATPVVSGLVFLHGRIGGVELLHRLGVGVLLDAGDEALMGFGCGHGFPRR